MTILGMRIRQLRLKNNLTQKQLGELVNVTKVSICCYEKGTRIPSVETLIDLSRVFKVQIDYLLGNDTFVVADNEEKYFTSMAKEEIIFIKEIKKHTTLHQRIIENPKRFTELMYKKLK